MSVRAADRRSAGDGGSVRRAGRTSGDGVSVRAGYWMSEDGVSVRAGDWRSGDGVSVRVDREDRGWSECDSGQGMEGV